MLTLRNLIAITIGVLSCSVTEVYAKDWKDSLEAKIESKWSKTKTETFGYNRITQAGTVLVIVADGITADHADDGSFTTNKVKAGEVRQAGGVAAALQTKTRSRTFRVGDRVYMTKVKVDDDNIQLFLLTTELFDFNEEGTTKQARRKSHVKFEFAKGYLQTADFAEVERALQAVVTSEAEAAAAKTVELGQTPEQVEAALGKPEKVVNLGTKSIFVYKDLKVIFVDGKVSDVE